VAGHGDITATGNAGTILDITSGGDTYVVANGDLVTGTTTKWDGDTQIFDGTYPPEGADNFGFAVAGDCCSLDGITHMITVFAELHDTFFIYENGGNQPGTIQCVFADDSLGVAQAFTAATFVDTTYDTGIGAQDLKGLVFTTDVPVKGVRIDSTGFDCFTVCAVESRMAEVSITVSGNDLTSVTVGTYTADVTALCTGTSTGTYNGGGEPTWPIENADNFNVLGSCAIEYDPIDTVLFAGGLWSDTNGNNPDFFIFENGADASGSIQAVFSDDSLGQAIAFSGADWTDTGFDTNGFPSSGLDLGGIALAITDLLDAAGNPLTNASVIKGLHFSGTDIDPTCICAVKPTGVYTLTCGSTAGGSVTDPGEGDFDYSDGTVVPILAAADAGYRFVEWTGTGVDAGKVAAPTEASTAITLDADYAVQANFVAVYTLTTSSTTGGSVTDPGEGAYDYDDGTVVPIVAEAGVGYQFTEWTGTGVDAGKVAAPTEASTTITVDADYAVQANFTEVGGGLSITVSGNDLTSITVDSYTVLVDDLCNGTSSGTYNGSGEPQWPIGNADNFDVLGSCQSEYDPTDIVLFEGNTLWWDTNGDNPDFFVFDNGPSPGGPRDAGTLQAVLADGSLGNPVSFGDDDWTDTGYVTNTFQASGRPLLGMSFAVTDLLDDTGTPLTNSSSIQGFRINSPGIDPTCICAVDRGSALTTTSTVGGSVTDPGEGDYDYEDGAVVPIVAEADPGYRFVEWTGTGVDAGKVASPIASSTTITMDADYAVEAYFIVVNTLTTTSTVGGSVTDPGEGAYDYDDGTLAPIVAEADPGYRFVEWTGTGVDAGKVTAPTEASTSITMDADYAVHANFIAVYTLTTSSTVGGSVTDPGQGDYDYDDGTLAPIVAEADPGYRFVEWTGTGVDAGKVTAPTEASTSITMDADYAVHANFIAVYTLTTTSTFGGSVTDPGEGDYDYDDGTLAPIVAEADPGYRFVEWTGTGVDAGKVAAPTEASTSITMDADYAVEANFGTTMYVDDDAPNDPGPGDPTVSDPLEDGSQEHPYDAIQKAIDAAVGAADIINVAQGIYTGLGNKDIDFGGKTITLQSDHGPTATIIDCEGSGRGFIFQSGEGADSVVDGFTITGGSETDGGGIYCSSDPTIINCVINGNSAIGSGGGIYSVTSGPAITNCLIINNSAASGGGMYADGSSLTVSNCTITGNSATSGGALYCVASTLSLTNCLSWENAATNGHELAVASTTSPSTLTVRHSDVEGGAGEAYVEAGCTLDLDGTCIDLDPLFTTGPRHGYYLSQIAAGQGAESPCVNAGSDTAANLGLDTLTTRTDGVVDSGVVDMGYHAPPAIFGDVDGNGVVDGLDLTAVITAWQTTPGDPLWNPAADLDGNGIVDGLDLTEVISNWSQ